MFFCKKGRTHGRTHIQDPLFLGSCRSQKENDPVFVKKKVIGPFPYVHCDGKLVLVNLGNQFEIIDTKSLQKHVSERDNNYHLIINKLDSH